jgi:hypothetical protein
VDCDDRLEPGYRVESVHDLLVPVCTDRLEHRHVNAFDDWLPLYATAACCEGRFGPGAAGPRAYLPIPDHLVATPKYARESMIRTAFLRVYLPEDRVSVRDLVRVPHQEVQAYDGGYGITVESMSEDGIDAHWNGQVFVCPRTPRLRILEGVLAVRRAYGQLGSTSVVPEEVARAAARELEALREEDPAVRPYILTSAWHVPLRWFVPFDPLAKELVGGASHAGVRYRVEHRQAMGRLRRSLAILGSAEIPESIVSEVRELHGWLDDFPPDTMVELDYGSVAAGFSEAALIMDESVGEIWQALEALESGDWSAAGEAYANLVTRWAAPMAVSYSN